MARPRTTTPSRPDDARAHRSMLALRNAFLELIERKSLDQISIKELTEVAGLSYPTFFRRFASKEELLEVIAREEVRTLFNIGETSRNFAAEEMCAYISARRKLWTSLLTGGASAAMRQEFSRASEERRDSNPRYNPWIPGDLATPFVTSAIFELLAWWLKQPESYPTQNVVTLFNALIIDNVVKSRMIHLEDFPAQ